MMYRKLGLKALTVSLIILGSVAIPASAQTWTGKWIWDSSGGRLPNQWMCLRKTFVISTVPASVLARISVDSKYWMWINGDLAVFEGGLKRGPNRTDTYYDQVDIAKYLKPGPNTIAVLAWYWGRNGFTHVNSGHGGFVLEADLGGTKIQTESTWKCLKHPAYDTTGAPNPNWRYAEFNIKFKAGLDMPGWNQPGFDDSAWPQAIELGVPPCAPWNNLVKRPIPQWKDFGLTDYVNKASLPANGTGGIVHAKLPYNAQVTPYLKVDAPAGLVIRIQTDHWVNPTDSTDTRSLRTEYVTKAGIQEFESLYWTNGEEVQYTIPSGVKILDLKFRETGYSSEFSGSFQCSDPFYNTLWVKSRRTLYLGLRDYLMGDPDRERAQWGDYCQMVSQAFYALDTNVTSLSRKAFSETMEWQMADSIFRSPIPNGFINHNYELPTQGLFIAGRYGLWTYYQYSGDAGFVRQAYPHVRDYLHLWKMNANGLIVHRTGTWDWTDWGVGFDPEVLQNVWYYLALESASKMAVIAGNNADVAFYTDRMQSIRNAFNNAFWRGSFYSSTSMPDERANALAVLAGLADSSKWEAITPILKSQMNASPLFERFVLEALFMMRKPSEALSRMKTRYAEMVSDPMTTLWELWDRSAPNVGTNHPWAGGPLILLSQYVAGISPDSAGYATYRVMPRLGSLASASANVTTVKGNVNVSISQNGELFYMTLNSPATTMATVGIPSFAQAKVIWVNGQAIYENGVFTGNGTGVGFAGRDSEFVKFTVAPGVWNFGAGASVSIGGNTKTQSTISAPTVRVTSLQSTAELKFVLTEQKNVNISVFSLSGELLGVLARGIKEPGNYSVRWKVPIASGNVLIVRSRIGKLEYAQKLLLLR